MNSNDQNEENLSQDDPDLFIKENLEISENSQSQKVNIIKKGNEISQLNISYDFLFKVSLLGDSGTGKTSILIRFIDNVFKEETSTTIGVDFKIVSFDLGDNTYAKMQIWDTCGSERFKSLTASFLKTCSAFVLVFDLTKMQSFDNITSWIKLIYENTKPKYLILIGNKADLESKREVSKETILKFCQKACINYIETSVKNNKNVEMIFKEVAYRLYIAIKNKKGGNNANNTREFEVGGFKNINIPKNNNNSNNNEENKENNCC